jgi:hypothetical protein
MHALQSTSFCAGINMITLMTIQFSGKKKLVQKAGIWSRKSEAYFFYYTYAQPCRSRVIYAMLREVYC